MNYLRLKFLIIFSVLLASCGGGGSDENQVTTPSSCINNISPDSITEPSITVRMTMANLPETLPVNMPDTQVNHSEYNWSVRFDMDSSGTTTVGDINISLTHYKFAGHVQKNCPLTGFDAAVFEVTSDMTNIRIATAAVGVDGNTLILKVQKSEHSDLENIVYSLPAQFSTYGLDTSGNIGVPGTHYSDSYPAQNSSSPNYIELVEGETYTDVLNDMGLDNGVDVRHVNLDTMEVIID